MKMLIINNYSLPRLSKKVPSILLLMSPFAKLKLKSINGLRVLMLIFVLMISINIKAQTLDSIIQLAVLNNPELKALYLDFEAEKLKADQVSQLPNPEIGLGVPILKPETRLGPQVVLVSASQMFPWFGTLKAKKEVVVSMSKAKYEKISATKLNLINQIKLAYYQLVYIKERLEILNENIEIFKSIETVSIAKVESGQSTTADVYRIQIKIQDLVQTMAILNNTILGLESKINALTNQSFSNHIILKDTFETIPILLFDLDSLQAKISNHHPLIAQLNYQIESSKQKQIVNNEVNKPTIGVGIDYSVVNQRVDANPINNGQDILIPKVKLSVPLYRKSYHATNKMETKYQEALSYQKINIENNFLTLLLNYKVDYDNALLKINLYTEQIETTKRAYDVLLANYSSKGKGFDELLQIQNQLLDYQLNLKKEKLNAYSALANIERLTNF